MSKAWKRGDQMPQTPEQFTYMGNVYEQSLMKLNIECQFWKNKCNILEPVSYTHLTLPTTPYV